MKALHQLEKTLKPWFKDLPRLPKDATTWIATNAWWLTLVGVVVAIIMSMALLPLLFGATLFVGIYGLYSPGYAAYAGLAITNAWITFLFFVAIIVIEAMAVNKLREAKKEGWDLLFLALVVAVVQSLVSAVLLVSVFKLFGAAVGALIGGYILFEIRDHFKK